MPWLDDRNERNDHNDRNRVDSMTTRAYITPTKTEATSNMEPNEVQNDVPLPPVVPLSDETDSERFDRQLSIRLANARPLVVFTYQCTNPKCRVTDHGRFFVDEPHPPYVGEMINCYKCGNGRKCKTVDEMRASGRGMKIIRKATGTGEPIPMEGEV